MPLWVCACKTQYVHSSANGNHCTKCDVEKGPWNTEPNIHGKILYSAKNDDKLEKRRD